MGKFSRNCVVDLTNYKKSQFTVSLLIISDMNLIYSLEGTGRLGGALISFLFKMD